MNFRNSVGQLGGQSFNLRVLELLLVFFFLFKFVQLFLEVVHHLKHDLEDMACFKDGAGWVFKSVVDNIENFAQILTTKNGYWSLVDFQELVWVFLENDLDVKCGN